MKVEFYTSKGKMTAFLLLTILFGAGCYWLTTIDELQSQIIGWLGVVFSGIGIGLFMKQLFSDSSKPVVVFDEEGIFDSRISHQPILWSEIKLIFIGEVHSNKFLCVETKEEIHHLFPKVGMGNKALGFPRITMNFSGVTSGLKMALVYLQEHQLDLLG